jgi:hypothetical protein
MRSMPAGFVCPGLANRIPAQRHSLCAPSPFSLSVCNGWGGSRRSEAYRRADQKIRNWAPSMKLDGMVQPTQERLCHMGTQLMAGNNPYGFLYPVGIIRIKVQVGW